MYLVQQGKTEQAYELLLQSLSGNGLKSNNYILASTEASLAFAQLHNKKHRRNVLDALNIYSNKINKRVAGIEPGN